MMNSICGSIQKRCVVDRKTVLYLFFEARFPVLGLPRCARVDGERIFHLVRDVIRNLYDVCKTYFCSIASHLFWHSGHDQFAAYELYSLWKFFEYYLLLLMVLVRCPNIYNDVGSDMFMWFSSEI